MRIPISAIKAGLDAEWPVEFDTPEEVLLMDLYEKRQIEIEFHSPRVENGKLVLAVGRMKRPILKAVRS